METTEYLAFIPLLIYGIALADLLGEWKRLFQPEGWYLPYLLMTLILTESAVYNVFIYASLILQMQGQDYLTYLTFLVPPILFLMSVNSFTPDAGDDTKTYFISKMRIFFLLIAVFSASHFFYSFGESQTMEIAGRSVAIILSLIGGIFRKPWVVYVLFVFWLLLFAEKASLIAT